MASTHGIQRATTENESTPEADEPSAMTWDQAPGNTDRRHFTVGDEVQFGFEATDDYGLVLVDEPDEAGCVLFSDETGAWGRRESRTHAGNLLHRSTWPCGVCDAFREAWKAHQDKVFDEHRADYAQVALERADNLRADGLTLVSTGGNRCGHGDVYALSGGADLPGSVRGALLGAVFQGPEGPWPNWGRTHHPVNWPVLIAQNPNDAAPDHGMLQGNFGPKWLAVVEAFALVRAIDQHAYMDVGLWVDERGRILIEPMAFFSTIDIDSSTATRVDDILADGGRPRAEIHHEEFAPQYSGWMLTC